MVLSIKLVFQNMLKMAEKMTNSAHPHPFLFQFYIMQCSRYDGVKKIRDNSLYHSFKTYAVIHHKNHLVEMVLMRGYSICFC